MTNNKKYRPAKVVAGIVCVGFAFWLLTVSLIQEDTPFLVRLLVLPGVAVFLHAAVQGLSKQ